jgi:dGTPase
MEVGITNPREKREEFEKLLIGQYGVRAEDSKGRVRPEEACTIRTCFQRDVDRIIHSKSFRRLKHKTQVFLQPEGDHYRTRLTHTLEVARIARTISRALELNEDLTEAIALGHDLGHTPFGHAGERALNVLLEDIGGFRHYEQSLRVVDRIEKEGRGLNLTYEVRNGIVCHTNDPLAETLEGQVVRLADRVAYINHDVDDAIRAGILSEQDIPEEIVCVLGSRHSVRINTITQDIIAESYGKNEITMSPGMNFVVASFHDFMYQSVYKNPKAKSEETKVLDILRGIFDYYVAHPDKLPDEYQTIAEEDGIRRAVCDYVSGMTDKYAIYQYGNIFIPAAWQVR